MGRSNGGAPLWERRDADAYHLRYIGMAGDPW